MIEKFLNTRLATTGSPTGVETKKGSESVSGLTLNWTTMSGVTRERLATVSNNDKH